MSIQRLDSRGIEALILILDKILTLVQHNMTLSGAAPRGGGRGYNPPSPPMIFFFFFFFFFACPLSGQSWP